MTWYRDVDRRVLLQWGVWGLAVAVVAVLLWQRSASQGYAGLARARVAQLSVPFAARVAVVSVGLFQPVRRGDVVALLDDEALQGQIAAVEAEIVRLRAEHALNQGLLDADLSDQLSDWDSNQRGFDSDAMDLLVTMQEVRADLEYDRAMLEGLAANAARLERLVGVGHAAAIEVELARAEADATAERVRANEQLLARLEQNERAVEQRRSAHLDRRPAASPSAEAQNQLKGAIAVQKGLLRELEALRDQCVLRAPFDGVVIENAARAGDAVFRRPGEGAIGVPGEVVDAGEPVVTVAADRPTEVVAYAVVGSSSSLEAGRLVTLRTHGSTPQIVESRISSVGPTVERLPEVLWNPQLFNQQIPTWGRPIVVPIPSGMTVATGDRVTVRIR
jgi:multidrug resistance efflux pump